VCLHTQTHKKSIISKSFLFVLSLLSLSGISAFGQNSTNIAIGSTTLQPSVKRMGINLGTLDFYDSGQTTQNLLMQNPGFEGQVWNSTIRCASGTATSCVDEDQWAAWPAGFWNGATFEVFYGSAAGRTGTVTYSTATGNGQGVTLNFLGAGAAPSNGDYLIVRKTVPGGATGGWWPATSGAGKISDNRSDLPPGTLGQQTAALTAPTNSDTASIAGYFDSVIGKTFLQLNGTYQVQFKAKGIGGSNSLYLQVARAGVATYFAQTVPLSNSWNTYTFTFTAAENGSAIGIGGVTFSTIGADSFELDDVSLTKQNGDPTNTTVFRDPVVNALRTFNPGLLRYWGGQLGDTLDNLITPQFGRQRSGYLAWYTESDTVDYGLHDFLQLCQVVGAEPWFVVPSTFSTVDAANLIEYLGGASNTPYGAKRTALGQATPWTQVFPKIHLEFGNEAWNGTFKGGTIEYSAPYGQRAQTIFGVMRANASFNAANYDLVLGGQAAYPGRNNDIQNNCNNNDSFDVAPYTMNTVDSYSDNESLYGSTFAEPEALISTNGSAEGMAPGMIYQDYQAIQSSNHPVPLSFYEVNLSTLNGAISQDALNSYTPSLGAGLMVADTMLLSMRQFGVVNQQLFALPQYDFNRPDGKTALLWGSVVDMGVTDRKRPQFLALELANQALSNGAAMLQTTHTGADPTWNQPMVNTVQMNGAHYLHSFAFNQGQNYSAVIFNLSRNSALPVTFSGSNAPSGNVQMQQLTSANPTDTNETANIVNIVPSTLSNFNAASGLSLPPYSMTVLTWSQGQQAPTAPVISGVTASAITGTSALISWTTDQMSSSLVQYGTGTAYGSASPLASALSLTHSALLTGLTPGTAYNYSVTSANSNGTSSVSPNYSFTTAAMPAPAISAVGSSGITGTSATITWTTDQASSSLVQYGTSTAYGANAQNATLAASHSLTLTGLTPGTTYNYAVTSANASGKSSTSANFTFVTAAQAPVISAVTSNGVTATSATITWTTDQAASSLVQYGTTASYGSASALNSTLAITHSVTLTGLTPGTTYNYAATSANAAGNSATSANFTFSTPAQAPSILALNASGITGTTATISWTTTQAASSQVQYGTSAAYGSNTQSSALITVHSMALTGLTPGTAYNYAVTSANASGLSTTSANMTFTTAAQAPVISAVASSGITGTSATITWTTDQPSSSQVVYGTSTAYGTLSALNSALATTHSVTLTGLTAGTTYNYAVSSANSAGNAATSTNFTFATTAPVQAPVQANGPQVSYVAYWGVTSSSVIISWSTNVPANTVIAYGTTNALGQMSPTQWALTSSHGVVLTGLASGTTYYFVAQSADNNGNIGYSTMYNFTTVSTALPIISGITAVPGNGNQAQLSWTTSVPTSSYVEFGLTTAYGHWSARTGMSTNPTPYLGWVPSGTVHCRLHSIDASGREAISPDYTFVEP
jgi:hypothetical protein